MLFFLKINYYCIFIGFLFICLVSGWLKGKVESLELQTNGLLQHEFRTVLGHTEKVFRSQHIKIFDLYSCNFVPACQRRWLLFREKWKKIRIELISFCLQGSKSCQVVLNPELSHWRPSFFNRNCPSPLLFTAVLGEGERMNREGLKGFSFSRSSGAWLSAGGHRRSME